MAALARAFRRLRAAAWLLVVGPALFIIAYWGMDPLGLMLWLTALANTRPWPVEYHQLDALSLTINAGALGGIGTRRNERSSWLARRRGFRQR